MNLHKSIKRDKHIMHPTKKIVLVQKLGSAHEE